LKSWNFPVFGEDPQLYQCLVLVGIGRIGLPFSFKLLDGDILGIEPLDEKLQSSWICGAFLIRCDIIEYLRKEGRVMANNLFMNRECLGIVLRTDDEVDHRFDVAVT